MAFRYRLLAFFVLFGLVFASGAALAAPMTAKISLGRDPEPPMCIVNPGGIIDITWDIEHATTPNYVYFKLEDPTRTVIYDQQTYFGTAGISINRQWTVPAGAPDGKYWVRVEYWSYEAGNEANAEVTFYVCTSTGSICAEKYEDVDRDGDCDEDSPVGDWWVCITTPLGDTYCKKTGSEGDACWEGLPLGSYTAYEPPVTGWNPVYESSYDVTLVADVTSLVTFCNVRTGNKGACCGPWGSMACIQAYGSWCADQGGIFMGVGTACGDGICSTQVEAKSWGAIKAMYR